MFKADEMSFRTIGKKFGNQKEVGKFRYAETAFFHLGAQNAHGRQWHSEGLELCFGNCVTYFLQCLKTENCLNVPPSGVCAPLLYSSPSPHRTDSPSAGSSVMRPPMRDSTDKCRRIRSLDK